MLLVSYMERMQLLRLNLGVLVVVVITVSCLNLRHLMVHYFASVNQWLKLVVLALDHLRHGLIKEVLGLVGPRWLV